MDEGCLRERGLVSFFLMVLEHTVCKNWAGFG
jgi:hypothetical protein